MRQVASSHSGGRQACLTASWGLLLKVVERREFCADASAVPPRLRPTARAGWYPESWFMQPLPPFFALMLVACSNAGGGRPARAAVSAEGGAATAGEVRVPRTVVTPEGASSVPELLEEAAVFAKQERWKEAGHAYARIYRLDPEGESASAALSGAGDAYDRANELEAALKHYELHASLEAGTARGRGSLVRATRILVFLGRFRQGGLIADRLLIKLDELTPFERIAVLSAKALALLERGDDTHASNFIEKGRDVVESNRLDAAGRVPRDLAQLYYALGESRRLRAERIVFVPMPPSFGYVLEARCQLLLDAQSAYSDSMRAYDAHWSAMAGFRVAELYQRLHQDLLAVKTPPSADTERKRQLFEGAVRLRYSVLLNKARGMAEHTLAMAQRTGEHSDWVERTRKALNGIEKSIAEEQAALARLPYKREDFEAYFAEMEAAAKVPLKMPAGKTPVPRTAPPP